MLRFGFSKWLHVRGSIIPWPTLAANVVSSVILGALLYWVWVKHTNADPAWRLFIGVGFCGGFSTFSTFSYETFALFENGQITGGLANIALNMVICLVAIWAGIQLAQVVR